MSVYDEPSFLFEIDESTSSPNVLTPLPIKPEQIDEIRDAFDKAGVASQDERRALVESVVVREVASLRELRAIEARRILQLITGLRSRNPAATGSAWDNREEDTWIDKL
jgi:DNA polymerase-3 subunit epsilon